MRALAAAALVAALLVPGCLEPEVLGTVERVWNVARKTSTENLPFENGGTRAELNTAWRLDEGSARIEFLDANGTVVFEREVTEKGKAGERATTTAGVSGEWTVRVTFRLFTGELGVYAEGRE